MKMNLFKKILIAITLLALCSYMAYTDYGLSKVNSSPLFTIKVKQYNDGTIKYLGLGYTVTKYNNSYRNYSEFKLWFTR